MDNIPMSQASSNLDTLRTLRRVFYLSLIPAVIVAGSMANAADVATPGGDTWTIDIQPESKVELVAFQADAAQPAEAPAPSSDFAPAPAEISEPVIEEHGIAIAPNPAFRIRGLSYQQVYDSIPFIRSVYLANPAYRHDATMELLTGIPRQSVHATYESQLNEPIVPQPEFLYNRYGTFGGTFGGGLGGYGGLGWGGGFFYRPQYAPAFRYFLPIEYGL